MYTIHFSQHYFVGDALFDDEDFYEEVVAEAHIADFHITCSLGIDDEGEFINWNLFYGNFFSGSDTIPLAKYKFDVFDEAAFSNNFRKQLRRMLMKAASGKAEDRTAAEQALTQL